VGKVLKEMMEEGKKNGQVKRKMDRNSEWVLYNFFFTFNCILSLVWIYQKCLLEMKIYQEIFWHFTVNYVRAHTGPYGPLYGPIWALVRAQLEIFDIWL
jgi:hypothetical protein